MYQKPLLAGVLACAAASIVFAGPPLICHPHDIGSAKSLPWKNDGTNKWDNPDPGYAVRQLSADTLRLLQPDMPVVVRMETLRRAAIYGLRDHAAASALLAALRERADGHPDALTSFDYACFLASLQQMKWWYKEDLSHGQDGSEYVKTAASLRNDPEIRPALALIQSTW
jgi:hypothetical protein